jgi:RNA polymerase sigma factor (sigma-70 family)
MNTTLTEMNTTLQSTPASLKGLADSPLVEACLKGDQDAWRELVARYSRLVLSVPRHYGLGEDDAHDVFQNVFAALVEQLPKLRDRSCLAKWLIATTRRQAWRQIQRQRRPVPLDNVPEMPDEAPLPAALAMRWERQHAVRQAVRRMGGRGAQLLTALYLEEPAPSYDEVARRLRIPRGSIGPTRARCLAKLLEVLRAEGLDEDF